MAIVCNLVSNRKKYVSVLDSNITAADIEEVKTLCVSKKDEPNKADYESWQVVNILEVEAVDDGL